MRGTVVTLFASYGFLQSDGEGFTRFFHAGSMANASAEAFSGLEVGDVVTLTPERHGNRPRAANVCLYAKAGNIRSETTADEEE